MLSKLENTRFFSGHASSNFPTKQPVTMATEQSLTHWFYSLIAKISYNYFGDF